MAAALCDSNCAYKKSIIIKRKHLIFDQKIHKKSSILLLPELVEPQEVNQLSRTTRLDDPVHKCL